MKYGWRMKPFQSNFLGGESVDRDADMFKHACESTRLTTNLVKW